MDSKLGLLYGGLAAVTLCLGQRQINRECVIENKKYKKYNL